MNKRQISTDTTIWVITSNPTENLHHRHACKITIPLITSRKTEITIMFVQLRSYEKQMTHALVSPAVHGAVEERGARARAAAHDAAAP